MRPRFTIRQARVRLSADTPVRWERVTVQADFAPHDHEFHEICIVDSGHAVHRSAEGDGQIKAHDVVVVPPGAVHAFDHPRNFAVTNLYFLSEWFEWDLRSIRRNGVHPMLFYSDRLLAVNQTRRPAVFPLTATEYEACRLELAALRSEGDRAVASPLWIKAAFSKLLILLSRAWERASVGEVAGERSQLVWEVMAYLDDAARAGHFNATELGNMAGISPDALNRRFHGETGRSLMQYFQVRRISYAAGLLLHSALSAKEVAERLNFSDGAHFARLFHRHHGLSPSAFRRHFGCTKC